jgi:hypothetical protein
MPIIVAVVAIWLLSKLWWLLAALAVALAVGRGIGGWLARRDDRAMARRRRDAELCARADRENALFIAGDPRGIYGEFPSVV